MNSNVELRLLYCSKPLPRNLWQTYKIYPDKLELQCRVLFHRIVIKKDILSITLCEPGWDFSKWWVLNFDFCPFYQHVLIKCRSRLWGKYMRFTPDNPKAFIDCVKTNF
jgi:hypothetical protein